MKKSIMSSGFWQWFGDACRSVLHWRQCTMHSVVVPGKNYIALFEKGFVMQVAFARCFKIFQTDSWQTSKTSVIFKPNGVLTTVFGIWPSVCPQDLLKRERLVVRTAGKGSSAVTAFRSVFDNRRWYTSWLVPRSHGFGWFSVENMFWY